MFSQASVILSGGSGRHPHPGQTPPGQTSPQADIPWEDTPQADNPAGRHPPLQQTARRYVSYWNALLSTVCFVPCIQWIPQVHLWCGISRPLDSPHASRAFFDPHISLSVSNLNMISCRIQSAQIMLSRKNI